MMEVLRMEACWALCAFALPAWRTCRMTPVGEQRGRWVMMSLLIVLSSPAVAISYMTGTFCREREVLKL